MFKFSFKCAFYRQSLCSNYRIGFIREPFYTLENHINEKTDQEIMRMFSPTIRNEINRCLNDNVKFSKLNDIESFMTIFNKFARRKSLSSVNRDQMESYGNDLMLTASMKENLILATHAYLMFPAENRVRLLYSCTNETDEQQVSASYLGKANKFLHFRDMCYFRDLGFEIYDFGGITKETTDRSKAGINSFKRSFGGEEARFTNYTSIVAEILLLLSRVLNRFYRINS